MDLAKLSVRDLLDLHVGIQDQLRLRDVTRTDNQLASELAEHLFCKAFGWHRCPNSKKDFDAIDRDRTFQIKGRRLSGVGASRLLGQIRSLPDIPFTYLAGVLFDQDFRVQRAALVPYDVVADHASWYARTNSFRFHLRDSVWSVPGVKDETEALRKVMLNL